jgi:hypothetical protein
MPLNADVLSYCSVVGFPTLSVRLRIDFGDIISNILDKFWLILLLLLLLLLFMGDLFITPSFSAFALMSFGFV